MSPHSVPVLGHQPNASLLSGQAPIYIGTRPDVALVEKALLELDRTKYQGKNASPVEIFTLCTNGDAVDTSKLCVAWALMLASQQKGSGATLSMFVPGPGEYLGPLDIKVQWNSQVKDLLSQIEVSVGRSPALSNADHSETSSSSGVLNSSRDKSATSSDSGAVSSRGDDQPSEPALLVCFSGDAGDIILTCHAQDGPLSIKVLSSMPRLEASTLRIIGQFEYVLNEISSPDGLDKLLVDLKAITIPDLEQIWTWNAQLPASNDDVCIHEIVMERARRHPHVLAISAHDGELTYQELDDLSTRLAHLLLQGGVELGSHIVVFIEKSLWVPVAQLAVMKAGCVSTVLDASLPLQRQQAIVDLVQPFAILTSPECEHQAKGLGPGYAFFTLSPESSRHWPPSQPTLLPTVDPSAWMYIVFTSGSTGTPKGAIISHANYASAVATQQKGLHFREFDRVFDFASYAFDAAWCNLIHALTIGGCLCIPSDEERKGDLAGALRKYRVNYAVLTPSVAWFPASELPDSLRTIHFGGEPLKHELVKELSKSCTVINAYGPAECSTVSTAIVADPSINDDPSIGTGLGACTWVVKLDGSDLVPIGEIGELWVEGPIVGQGYLGDVEKTSAAFPDPPEWLTRSFPGRNTDRRGVGRLYRTGDLVRYKPDGNLDFVGRKDSQVKIRGQRVELGEIEHNLQRALTEEARATNVQIMAEVIKPRGSNVSTLVAFVFLTVKPKESSVGVKSVLEQALVGMEDRLARFVPPYMIPSAFFPVEDVPMTPTGKVNRRQLRQDAPTLYWEQVHSHTAAETSEERPESASQPEEVIRQVWSQVLNLPVQNISLNAPFTRLGGDSITAMQVVSRCRSQNIAIKVTDILKLQTIRSIAPTAKPVHEEVDLRSVEADGEGKSWPLTPIQQIFFSNNPRGVNHYTLSFIVKLEKHAVYQTLLEALLALTARHGMLRARFHKVGSSWEQYIAPAGPTSFLLEEHDFVKRSVMQDIVDHRQANLDLVHGPVFAVDVFNSPDEAQTLLMSAHHAIMDLVSWRIVWHELSQYLSGTAGLPPLTLSFQTWSRLQREEAEAVTDPATVLPFNVTPPNFEYWDVTPRDLYFQDSELHLSIVGAEETSLLLGASNDCFRTEILDILLGTLVYCFTRVFTDRSPPPVFIEGHGREPVAGMEDFNLSEVVGWFTTLHPVDVAGFGGSGCSILDMIKAAKDVRGRVPGKGRPYFAARFHSAAGRKAFKSHEHPELIFNYRGSFQQLEDANSIFRLEDRGNRAVSIPGDGDEYLRPSLIDLNLVVQQGELQVWTRYHKRMPKAATVARWADVYAKGLSNVAHQLLHLQPSFTLADFPLLTDISYAGLDTLTTEQLFSHGVKHEDIKDIYPCTPIQEGILLSLSTGAASYNSVNIWRTAVAPGSKVSVPRLNAAWDVVSRSHPVFSTVFSTNPDTGRFVQVVLNRANEAIIREAPPTETALGHMGRLPPPAASPSQAQCFFTICTDNNGDVACRLDMTHALMDALSLPVIASDLEKAYAGEELSLRTPFRDYVEHIQHMSDSDRLKYWEAYLCDVQACDLPGSFPFTSTPGKNAGSRWLTLPKSSTAPIASTCRASNLTRSAFLHLAWSLVLSYFTGMREVCFGYLSSGRDAPIDGVESMVGPLINMLIARVDLTRSLAEIVADINKYNIEHLKNQHVSLAELQHSLAKKRLFNTNITVREARRGRGTVQGGMELVETSEEDPHEYDLVLAGTTDKDDTEVSIQYRTDFATPAQAQEIQTVLQYAIEFLGSVLEDLDLKHQSLLEEFFDHAFGTSEALALEKWQGQFKGIDASSHFPSLPYASHKALADSSATYTIDRLSWRSDYAVDTQVLAAWALLQASYTGCADVLLGACAERSQPLPLRVHVHLNQSLSSYLEATQSTLDTWSELPRLPLHRLRLSGGDTALACDFQMKLSTNGAGLDDVVPGHSLSLRFEASAARARVVAKFDSQTISPEQVTRLFSQLEAVLRRICLSTNDSVSLTEIDTVSEQDLQAIRAWNEPPFQGAQDLVHDLITQTVQVMPDALAISAWDGELTYHQLDQLSTRLAHHLVHCGVGPEVIVPIYSEKSKWVPVCAVAIMKASGAGVMIDYSQPLERVQSILKQIKASFVLVSRANAERVAHLQGLQLMVIDQASMDALPIPADTATLPRRIQPCNLAYISFTSGSTGKPKGAMISHANFASSIRNQQKALGFRTGQRVYDFASYAFDAAWSNLLHSLTSGSCLCIPSEEQRKNALSDSIRDSRATLLNATPSVLRHLDPKELPDIEQVLMGGEAWAEADFLDWIDRTRLINSYGPGECTIKSCLIQAYRGMVPNTIGFGIGVNTWIIRTDGSDRLAPLGSVGELWLEGPQVGRGYIGDEERTAASYVTRPRWTDSSGTPCRFYRTGDLVRYGADGALIFVSRKDTQVKIRGQRTELGEVEQAIKRALLASGLRIQVVADVFKPHNSDNPILVAFLQSEAVEMEDSPDHSWQQKLSGVDEKIATMVPDYMVPTAYIALDQFPMTATGKIHRRGLRQTYQQQTLEQIVGQSALRVSGHRAPSTEQEVLLQHLWSEVLKIDPQTISADDSFLRIGGDSLGAMLLVGAARKRNITLSVTDIFKLPKLSDLATFISSRKPAVQASLPPASVVPFELLNTTIGSAADARNQAASLCGLEPADIEDVFPCTTLQAGLLAETVKRPGDNVLTELWAFKHGIDLARFRAVVQQVVRANLILRTRIVDLPGQGLVQVVVRPGRCGLEDGIEAADFRLGTPLVSYNISTSGFLWSIHHALYDGWSMPLILDSMAKGYHDPTTAIPQAPPFQFFIKYLQDVNQVDAEKFWRGQFRDFSAQTFPVLPTPNYTPECDQRLSREVNDIAADSDFTLATRVKLAWAILSSTVTNSTDASFGTTVSGRQVDVPGIEDMTGPTIATVPLRVVADRSRSVRDLLQAVQLQAADMMPFEQTGLQNIRRLSEDCELGCQFQSLVVIQPRARHDAEASLFDVDASPKADDVPFKHYAICLDVVLSTNSISVGANFDSNVVPVTQFHRLMDRFENILRQISTLEVQAKPAHSLDTTCSADLEQIWSWNQSCVQPSEETIHKLFGVVAATQPDAPAVCSWDGDFTYGQVDDLSTRIAHILLKAGLRQTGQRIVPLFFQKSKWMSVCQIAVMKSNATALGIDVSLPGGRLQTIMDLVHPQVVLASPGQASRARELCPPATRVVVIGDSYELDKPDEEDLLPAVDPDTWLYVVFTSGSTGVPKGVIITHSNFASALKYGLTFLRFGPQSRTYDFVSYAFDVSWLNVLYTLCAGGCLCVPSQYEIQNEPAEAVGRRQANTAFITPTVGRLLHGTDIKVINYGGEPLGRDEIDYWSPRATVIHSYGPSECTPIAISHILDPERDRVIIGQGLGSCTWVVEPEHGNSLAAIGDIGELWLEGPLVGQGYLNEPDKTASAFVEDPEWLLQGGPGSTGRRGRLYRTGDLVRYEEDGNLEFIGRKDAQIKIRGQRIELEEIERHVLNAIGEGIAIQVVVDIVKPADSSEPALVAFIKLAAQERPPVEELAASTRTRLAAMIPSYMVPNGYLLMDDIPTTTSGKVDRGQLRKAAMAMPKAQLLHVGRSAGRPPTTAEEARLHSLVARVLSLDPEAFGMDENFILLGGDSISAMRLASAARQEGILLSVADILSKNRICELLETGQDRVQDEPVSDSVNPASQLTTQFSCLGSEADRAAFFEQEVLPQLQDDPGRGKLVALLPVTHMQSVYLRDNLYSPRRSWLYSYVDFTRLPDEHVLVNKIEKLVEICDIYRTAFVPYGNTFVQAVFDVWRPKAAIIDGQDDMEGAFDRLVEEEVKTPVVLGAPLVLFKLIRGLGRVRLVFGMSHAIYDAISMDQTLSLLSEIYNLSSGLPASHPASFSSYVTHIKTATAATGKAYWKDLLQHSSMTSLPCTKLAPDTPPTILTRSIPLPRPPQGITQATLFTYACASSLAHLTGSSDIVFGRVVSGRSSLPSSLSNVVGPCLNRIPVRVAFSPERTKSQRLLALQKQSFESIPHESTGLDEITQACGWDEDTRWGCLTQYQNVDEQPGLDLPGVEGRMKTKEMLGKVPVRSDFLEIFAIPGDGGSLTVKVISGSGYEEGILGRLLEGVCSELVE